MTALMLDRPDYVRAILVEDEHRRRLRAAAAIEAHSEIAEGGAVADRTIADYAHAVRLHEPPVPTPDSYRFLYHPPLGAIRYRISWGGRGAARSWSFARAALMHGLTRPLRILCAREWQNSIRDSVHRVLSDQIRLLGLDGFYNVQASSIIGTNGTEFIFRGLRRDIAAIKSTEGINLCWVEEGQSVSDHSWRELIPTIRAEGSEIWVTFNTGAEDDPTYQRLVVGTRPSDGIVQRTTFRDNPWFPAVLRQEEEKSRMTDPEEHAHIWDGEFWHRSRAQVLAGKWVVQDFTPDRSWGEPYYGADWGFAHDPTMLMRVWVRDSRLWVEYESGGVELGEAQTVDAFDAVPESRRYVIRADSARPETISAIKRRGFRVEAAPKWSGSVEDGVAHLRSYTEIVIHSRCQRAIREARLWRYRTRAGASGDPHAADAEILPTLHDGNDHTWDAIRYALAPLIRRRDDDDQLPPSISEAVG